jgi:hypothetical protein
MKTPNPHLTRAFLEIVENQIRDNDPPETKETVQRLVAQGISKQDAKILVAQAVCVEIWDAMTNGVPFNRERFVRNLRHLPNEPQES